MKPQLTIELRNQQVTIEFSIGAAEPDVGIMSSYVEDYRLLNEAGNELDWIDSLTKEETDKIDNAIANALSDDSYYEEDYP